MISEDSAEMYTAKYYINFHKNGLAFTVKFEDSFIKEISRESLEVFTGKPRYLKRGVFSYWVSEELKSVDEVFEKFCCVKSGLKMDLDRFMYGNIRRAQQKDAGIFSWFNCENEFYVKIDKEKYCEVNRRKPDIWFGDFYLFVRNLVESSECTVKCYFDDKLSNSMKKYKTKTVFKHGCSLINILRHFSIVFHDKVTINCILYKLLTNEKIEYWKDIEIKFNHGKVFIVYHGIECPEEPKDNPIDFLKEIRAKYHYFDKTVREDPYNE